MMIGFAYSNEGCCHSLSIFLILTLNQMAPLWTPLHVLVTVPT